MVDLHCWYSCSSDGISSLLTGRAHVVRSFFYCEGLETTNLPSNEDLLVDRHMSSSYSCSMNKSAGPAGRQPRMRKQKGVLYGTPFCIEIRRAI